MQRKSFRLMGALVTAVAAICATPSVAAQHAPLGYQIFCLQQPSECEGGGTAKVALTSELMATLKRVNHQVNTTIRPRNDRGPDVWSATATTGDCEDYVLAKRRALIQAGVSPSSLRIAYVKTARGVGHAILVVKTGKRDLVLDNRTHAIKPLSQSGYRIISISGADPAKWS